MLLGAVSVWTRIDAGSARGRRSVFLHIGRSFYHNDTQLSAQVFAAISLFTAFSDILRVRVIGCPFISACEAKAARLTG